MRIPLLHRVISSLLLGLFLLAIIPAESFHHHDFESVSCVQNNQHIEEKSNECLLADFVIPSINLNSSVDQFYPVNQISKLEVLSSIDFKFQFHTSQSDRAPPVV